MSDFPLHEGVADVVAVRDVTPAMRRVRLRHPAFGPGFPTGQPGAILTLGWPDDGGTLQLYGGGTEPVEPVVATAPDGSHWRNFTVRAHRPEEQTVDVDLFLHGDLGPGARWALQAQEGQRLGFAGPRPHWAPDGPADWSLLVADETALPALLAIVEQLPGGHRAVVVAEVSGPAEEQEVATAADVAWHWVHRGEQPPGTTTLLRDAVADCALPAGQGRAWGGAESGVMKAVREALEARAGKLPAQLIGYWKRQ